MISISKREKTLLVLLAAVILVVGVGGGVLQPNLEEWMRLREAVAYEHEVRREMEDILKESAMRDVEIEQKREEFLEESGRYHGWLDGHDMGRLVVTWLDESGLHSERMSIDVPKALYGEDSVPYVGLIHGTAVGTREAVCDFLDLLSVQKAVKLAGFSLTSQEDGTIRMGYEVQCYMIREWEELWRD